MLVVHLLLQDTCVEDDVMALFVDPQTDDKVFGDGIQISVDGCLEFTIVLLLG